MKESANLHIPKLGSSLLEVNLKLDEAKEIFYESLKKFDSVRKCMDEHEEVLDSFKNGVVILEKELDENKDQIISDLEEQKRLESTITLLEEKMESQVENEGQLRADYHSLECEKEQLLQELDYVKSLAVDMGKDFQIFNKEVSRTGFCLENFWNAEVVNEEEEKITERIDAALISMDVLDMSPKNRAIFQMEVRHLLSNVNNLHARLIDLKVEVDEKMFINKESYDTMIFSLVRSWQLKVEEMAVLASKKIEELESSRLLVEHELQEAKQCLQQKCAHEDKLNEVIVDLLDEKQLLKDQLKISSSSKVEILREIDHSRSKLSKAENRISNLECKGKEKDTMLLELTIELETASDLISHEKQRNESTISDLKESFRKANHKLVKESAASDSLAKEVFALQQTLDETNRELFDVSNNFNEQEKLTEDLKEQFKKYEVDLQEKNNCLAEYEGEEQNMIDAICAMQHEKTNLNEQVTKVQSSQEDLSEKYGNVIEENTDLKQKLAELKMLYEDFKKSNENNESSKKDLNNQLDSVISYKDELEQKNIIVEVEKRNLRDQVDKLLRVQKQAQSSSGNTKNDGSKANLQISKLKSLLRVKDSQLMELADELQSISDMHIKGKEEDDKAISSLQQSLLNANYLSLELNAELDYVKGLYAKETEAHKATVDIAKYQMIGNEISIPEIRNNDVAKIYHNEQGVNNNKAVRPSINDVNCRSITPTSKDSDEKRNESTFTAKARTNHGSRSENVWNNSPATNSCNTSFSSASYVSRSKRDDEFKVAMYSTEMDNMSQAPKERLLDKEVEIMYMG